MIFFTIPRIPNVEPLAMLRFMMVIMSCAPSEIFAPSVHSPAALPTARPKTNGVNLEDFHLTNNLNEDIAWVLVGLTVDDNHELAKENVPDTSINFALDLFTGLYQGQKWHWDGHYQ